MAITGVDGNVTIPAGAGIVGVTNLHIFEWSADIQQEVVDDSNFEGSDNWKTKVATMHHLIGTCRGTIVKDSALSIGDFGTQNAPAIANFLLQSHSGTSTNAQYDFSGIISNINTVVVKTDRAFITLSFESSGDVTVTPRADT
ncbi:hypothetical protein LCGC14_0943270 [marine sediment metagenome]|uniref:Uncharacterized protein n=1 Tax=marine sediment metagenome TaxID=412755 RepID=A0A0F9RQR3_9ZZZZ